MLKSNLFFFPQSFNLSWCIFPWARCLAGCKCVYVQIHFFFPPPYCQHVTSGEADQILPLGLNPVPSGKQDTICCHWAGRRSVRWRCQGRPLPSQPNPTKPPLPPPPPAEPLESHRSSCEVPALEATGAVFEKIKNKKVLFWPPVIFLTWPWKWWQRRSQINTYTWLRWWRWLRGCPRRCRRTCTRRRRLLWVCSSCGAESKPET